MTMDLRSRIARCRLPMGLHTPEDVDGVRLLRAAGLFIALVLAPSHPLTLSGMANAVQVLITTRKVLANRPACIRPFRCETRSGTDEGALA